MDFDKVLIKLSQDGYTNKELAIIAEKYFTGSNNFNNLVKINNAKKTSNCIALLKLIYNILPPDPVQDPITHPPRQVTTNTLHRLYRAIGYQPKPPHPPRQVTANTLYGRYTAIGYHPIPPPPRQVTTNTLYGRYTADVYPPSKPSNIAESHSVPTFAQKILKFIRRFSRIKYPEKQECVICIDSPVEVVFIPCGHACACTACSDMVNSCPICRSRPTHKNKIYIS